MADQTGTPFDSVEGAHEYLRLLSEVIAEARNEIEADIRTAEDPRFLRRLEALRLVQYKLERLEQSIKNGRRLLNDLRTLRRLLLDERVETFPPQQK